MTTTAQPRDSAVSPSADPPLADPPVGLIGLTLIHGDVGKAIEFGEWLNGDGFKAWEHAFISIGGGLIVEAEPGGARVSNISEYSTVHWCHGLYDLGTPEQLNATEDAAKKYTGVPYSFLDYVALVDHRLHIPFPGLQGYIASTGHMICSQLVDQCYSDAGMHIFTDGRWPGYVDPLALYNRDLELGGVAGLWRPGER
jgi:hypothetical protein